MRAAIVTAATGHGHLSAARALAEAIEDRGGTAKLFDFGAAHRLLGALVGAYNRVLRRPPGWMGAFFRAVNAIRPDRYAYPAAERWFRSCLLQWRPSILLSVHPMANHGLIRLMGRAGIERPLAIVMTDAAPPFWRGWVEPRASLTTAPSAEAVRQLVAWGTPRDRVRLGPIPIRPVFLEIGAAPRAREARRALGLEDRRFTVAISAGTAARRSALQAYRALAGTAQLAETIQVVFLAGTDQRLAQAAAAVVAKFPVTIVGWREDPEAILAAADVLFTKPGGLTVFETLAAGVPLLMDGCDGVMPQEQGNARWALASGAAWLVRSPDRFPDAVLRLLGGDREEYRERARKAVEGDALTVVDMVRELVGTLNGHHRIVSCLGRL